jgi:maleate cis-trans isomerase
MASTRGSSQPTIAWLKPGPVDRAVTDVFAMTPPDVRMNVFTSALATQMMEAAHFDAEGFDRDHRHRILETVRDLAAYSRPDVTVVTGDLIQSAMGVEWDRALQASIAAETGGAAATAMTAITDALRFVGASRVALASPFREEQNAYMRRYLEDAGLDVTAVGGFPTHSIREVRALPNDAPLTLGKSVYDMDRRAEAVIVACPIWRVAPHIEPLEQACGVPVLAILNTLVWFGLHTLGHTGEVSGYGRLLEKAVA